MCGIHRGPVNSPHKGPVTRKMFPFDDVIMLNGCLHIHIRYRKRLGSLFIKQLIIHVLYLLAYTGWPMSPLLWMYGYMSKYIYAVIIFCCVSIVFVAFSCPLIFFTRHAVLLPSVHVYNLSWLFQCIYWQRFLFFTRMNKSLVTVVSLRSFQCQTPCKTNRSPNKQKFR